MPDIDPSFNMPRRCYISRTFISIYDMISMQHKTDGEGDIWIYTMGCLSAWDTWHLLLLC